MGSVGYRARSIKHGGRCGPTARWCPSRLRPQGPPNLAFGIGATPTEGSGRVPAPPARSASRPPRPPPWWGQWGPRGGVLPPRFRGPSGPGGVGGRGPSRVPKDPVGEGATAAGGAGVWGGAGGCPKPSAPR